MASVLEYALQFVLKSDLLEKKNIKKIHGLPGDHETLSTVRHVGLHVDFSSTKSSLGLHLRV